MEANAHLRHPSYHYDDYAEGTMEEGLRILRQDSSTSIPEIEIRPFVDYILPPLPKDIDVEEVVLSLRDEGLITSNGRWRDFQSIPAKSEGDEDAVFAPLAEICQKASQHASNAIGRDPTFILSLLPKSTPRSHRGSTCRPNGYFILKEAEDRAQHTTDEKAKTRWWYDIALTTEFKKRATDRDLGDDVSKLVFNIQQTMTLDPCRRFSFGITIENTRMRVWFCSRATIVVSKEIRFTKNVSLLVRILLSFAFASKEDLGWDPTIRPCTGIDGGRQYQIDVDDQTYKTEELLSDVSSDALLSRATRVWRVKRLGFDEPFVLKDVWVEDGQELEHSIYDMILHDMEEMFGPDVRKKAASHLLTPVAHWLVPVNGEEDHTTKIMMRGYSSLLKGTFKVLVKDTNDFSIVQDKSARRELGAPFPRHYGRRRTVRRRHYRVVFKEVADPLYAVMNLSDVFVILRDISNVLQWIHGSGWVHRDISASNLFIHKGLGLIGDLEFAKRKNTDVENERCIGTPGFIANEASCRSYLYNALCFPRDYEKAYTTETELMRPEKEPLTFFHNDLHDLESLWWTAIWKLCNCRDAAEVQNENAPKTVWKRDNTVNLLFDMTEGLGDRRLFVEKEKVYEECLSWYGESLRVYKRALNGLRIILLSMYRSFESTFPAIDMQTIKGLHDYFRQVFEACQKSSVGIELTPFDCPSPRTTDLVDEDDDEDRPGISALEYDTEDESSDSSSSASDCGTRRSVSSTKLTAEQGGYPGNWWYKDFLTPMPSLHIPRYRLEICRIIT